MDGRSSGPLHPLKAMGAHVLVRYGLGLLIVCAATFAVLTAPLFTDGRTLLWYPDGLDLYFNFFMAEGEWLRNLLGSAASGQPPEFSMYTYELGYGADFLASLGGCMNDPFNLISVFFHGPDGLVPFEALIFIRFYLSALAFSLYCFSKGRRVPETLCASVCYLLMGYTFMWGLMRHPNFMNVTILLPLIFWGADRIFQGRSVVPFTAVMALSFLFSVYFSYMICFVLLAYCLIKYFIADGGRLDGRFARLLGTFILCTVIAVCLAGVVFLPMVLTLTSMGRVGMERTDPVFATPLFYLRYGAALLGAPGDSRGVPIGALPLLCVFALGVSGKLLPKKMRRAWMTGLVLGFAGSLVPYVGHILNGFGYSTDRWLFALDFCCAYAVALTLPLLPRFSRRQWAAVAAGAAVVALWAIAYGALFPMYGTVACWVVLVIAFAGLFAASRLGAPRQWAVSAVALVIAVAGCGIMGWDYYAVGRGGGASSFVKQEAFDDYFSEIPLDRIPPSGTVDPYRIDRAAFYGPGNLGLMHGFMGADFQSSYYNQNVDDLRQDVAMADNSSNYSFSGNDSRMIMGLLTGQRYFILSKNGDNPAPYGYELVDGGDDGYDIYETQRALPLAFTAKGTVSLEDYRFALPLERMELLSMGCVLEGAETTVDTASDVRHGLLEVTGVENGTVDESGITVFPGGATLTLKGEGTARSENYVMLKDMRFSPIAPSALNALAVAAGYPSNEAGLWQDLIWPPDSIGTINVSDGVMTQPVRVMTSAYSQYGGKTEWAVNLGYSDEAVVEYKVYFATAGRFEFAPIESAQIPVDKALERMDALKAESRVESLELSTNGFSVNVAASPAEASDHLVATVPYSCGWSATVDGRQVPIDQADIAFMAVSLDGKAHRVEFSYVTPGIVPGAVLTVLGLVGFVGLIIFGPSGPAGHRRVQRRKGTSR